MAVKKISPTETDARVYAPALSGLRAAAVLVLLQVFLLPVLGTIDHTWAANEPVHGDVRVATEGGYARIVFRLDEQVESKIHLSGTVLIVDFKQPVDLAVDRINASAPDYVSAARKDPDGMAVRMALVKGYRVNAQTAGERLFIDILPMDWQGVTPGLPQEVVEELARRTREAERQLRQQRLFARQRNQSAIQVKIGTQPTFTRYVFDLPNFANVVPERSDGKLTLNFDQPIRYDLADAKASMPTTLASVDAEVEHDSVAVSFVFNGSPDVRLFREDRSIVVDIDNGGITEKQQMTENGLVRAESDGTLRAPAIASPEIAPTPKPERLAAPDKAVPATTKPAPLAAASAAPKREPAPKPAAETPAKPPPKAAADIPAGAPPPKPASPAPVMTQKTVHQEKEPVTQLHPAAVEPPPPRTEAQASAQPATSPAPPAHDENLPKPIPAPSAAPVAQATGGDGKITVAVVRHGDNLKLGFRYGLPTPAAMFSRGDMLWLVFDTDAPLNISSVQPIAGRMIRSIATEYPRSGETIVRMRLERPRLATLSPDGTGWELSIGEGSNETIVPLTLSRSMAGQGRASIAVPFTDPRQIHRLSDPDIGDKLVIVTALGPARGFVKAQDFIELRALVSAHGVVVQPLADDIMVELSPDKIVISRPNGLTLSSTALNEPDAAVSRTVMFDNQTWGFDRGANFQDRQAELMANVAAAPEARRRSARLDLARFYLARGLVTEAKAVIDVILQDDKTAVEDVTGVVMKAMANVMLDRPAEALKELANPAVGDQNDAPLWRAVALSRQGKWAESHERFKTSESTIGNMPVQLQHFVMLAALRTNIEMRDYASATQIMADTDSIGIPPEYAPTMSVLRGRLNEALGMKEDAVNAYRAAADSEDRKSAAQGRLREVMLRFRIDEMKRDEVIAELEKLTATWRGDETEVEGLQHLAHFYTEDGRYRDAFHVMRVALLAHANSDLTRRIQDEAARTFDSIFLGNKGDVLPPIEALGLFYDYRDLTPIGRRGDEMIRRLAERLVAVDLLEQASELLDYQVTNRLQGAARAQVATRLAVVYLMNRKPDRALAALRMTRISGLSTEMRNQRLLLEARALSAIGRHDLALEIVANMQGIEVTRLRSDVYWASKRWREAAEQLELLHGSRWKEFAPLNDSERADILRAALGYALSEDKIGLAAFREKYAAKMADGSLRQAFELIASPGGVNRPEFRDVASAVAAQDTLGAFLRAVRARYPEATPAHAAPVPPAPVTTPETKPVGAPQASAPQTVAPPPPGQPPQIKPAAQSGTNIVPRSDPSSTGSIGVGNVPILPPVPPRGVKLNPVPPPATGPRIRSGVQVISQ